MPVDDSILRKSSRKEIYFRQILRRVTLKIQFQLMNFDFWGDNFRVRFKKCTELENVTENLKPGSMAVIGCAGLSLDFFFFRGIPAVRFGMRVRGTPAGTSPKLSWRHLRNNVVKRIFSCLFRLGCFFVPFLPVQSVSPSHPASITGFVLASIRKKIRIFQKKFSYSLICLVGQFWEKMSWPPK